MRVAVVTDSTADLPPVFLDRYGVTMVPLTIEMEGASYRDRVDLDPEAFLERLPSLCQFPHTAAPAPGAFYDVYRRILDSGADAVISIHLARGLSATVTAAETAAAMVGDAVHVVDGESASLGTGLLVWWAARRARAGMPATAIREELEWLKGRLFALTAPITLEYLARGGRIGQAQRWVGTLLDMKPVLALERGAFRPERRVRGERQLVPALLAAVGDRVERGTPVLAALGHAGFPQRYGALEEGMRTRYEVLGWLEGVIGPAISAHVGPGAFGVIVLPLTPEWAQLWKETTE
ncbi:MAG: DegV family protein [Firmicutes bacterium]|nr:DegV family protein [Bacillota bacterium]